MKFAINGNRHQEGHFDAINRLVTTLLKRGDDIVMAEPFLNYLTDNLGDRFAIGIDYVPLSTQPNADLAISIGRWQESTPAISATCRLSPSNMPVKSMKRSSMAGSASRTVRCLMWK